MRVLITGAGGLVASALVFHFEEVFALGHGELDIADAGAVDNVFERLRPDLVINCAVIGVDACERDRELAERVNVDGPANLATAAAKTGASILHCSSNYVFSGRRHPRQPYTIEDDPDPINVYGATKVAGERAVLERCDRAFIVRTSWVYGPGKSSFLGTVAADLRRGVRVQAIADTWASTTYVEDLARRVRQIVGRGTHGTYHVVNDGVCSYESFAREAGSLAGVPANVAEHLIEVVSEASMQRPAARPAWTAMRCLLSERIGFPPMRSWREALSAYVSG
jgi:dTDP-4-dehydrorhamnose reductase